MRAVPTRGELCVGVNPQLVVDSHSNGASGFQISSRASKETDLEERCELGKPRGTSSSTTAHMGSPCWLLVNPGLGTHRHTSRTSGAMIKDAVYIYQVEVWNRWLY